MIASAVEFAEKIGLAFQIRDDVLDVISIEEELGKPIGSDSESQKSTYVSLVGLEKAQKDVQMYTDEAITALNVFGKESETLKKFALSLVGRKK